jgi:hypothetical protein
MAGVEFLPEEHDDAAPVVEDEGQPRVPRRSVRSWAVRGAFVALVVAVLATWIATRPDGAHRAQPQAGASSPPDIAEHLPPELGTVQCTFGAPVETEISDAMKRFLRPIAIANLRAYRCVRGTGTGERVVSETVLGLHHGLTIQVDTSTNGLDLAPGVPDIGTDEHSQVLLGGVESEAAGLTVRVTVRGPIGRTPPRRKITDLAEFLSLNLVL